MSLGTDIVAGTPSLVAVTPRGQYGNEINAFGLTFSATATPANTGGAQASYTFTSEYHADTSKYFIPVTLTELGPPQLNSSVLSIVCSEVSQPNDVGNKCVCNEGYARQLGMCAICPAGNRPLANRELGCESCVAYINTASTDGLECVECETGFEPNSDFSECIACAPNNFFSFEILACWPCDPGMELNYTTDVVPPCDNCPPFYAGLDGTRTVCPDGKQPTDEADGNPRQLCKSCPTAMAGTRGECFDCPPGRYQKEDQSTCLECRPGTFRNLEIQPECTPVSIQAFRCRLLHVMHGHF